MKKKNLWLALPLAAGLMLAACGGSNDAPAQDGDAGASSSATPSSATPAPSSTASGSAAAADASSGTGGAALTDAQLKKVVAGYFDKEDNAQVLAGDALRAQAGAAGALISDAEVSPKKCGVANGIDIKAELKKSNLAVAAVANPENPMQTVSVTAASAKDAARAESTFADSTKALDGCEKLSMKTMGMQVTVTTKVADVDVAAPASLAVITSTEVKGQKIPGASVIVFDNGLQVQMQAQGLETDDEALQDMAEDAQELLEQMKAL